MKNVLGFFSPSVYSSKSNKSLRRLLTKILPANISRIAIHINFEMKGLTKAHWCERPFQAQWLQITLRRLVPAIALRGKWFAQCQDKQRGEKTHFALFVSLFLPLPSTFVHIYIVQYKVADIHICLNFDTYALGSVWCIFSMREPGTVVTSGCLFKGVECEQFMERERNCKTEDIWNSR